MNDTQHEAYRTYLRDLADTMELRDWTITLSRDRPENRNHNASVSTTYGRKKVTVWICDAFFRDEPTEQRQTLVHELIHVHVNPIKFCLDNAADTLGKPCFGIVQGCMDDATEYAVDALADVIAPFMPLPPTVEIAKENE